MQVLSALNVGSGAPRVWCQVPLQISDSCICNRHSAVGLDPRNAGPACAHSQFQQSHAIVEGSFAGNRDATSTIVYV